MNVMRDRAKAHFPSVLLTLLGIVQALALELFWAHLHETVYPFELSFLTAIAWIQTGATFLSILLIWTVYASNVMRFRHVPAIGDLVYPFFIGILEFMLVDTLWPGEIGLWLILISIIFAMMVWVSQITMRRASQDRDNAVFFSELLPAELPELPRRLPSAEGRILNGIRDFSLPMAVVGALTSTGVYLLISGDRHLVALLAMLITTALLGWQFSASARFWARSVEAEPDS